MSPFAALRSRRTIIDDVPPQVTDEELLEWCQDLRAQPRRERPLVAAGRETPRRIKVVIRR